MYHHAGAFVPTSELFLEGVDVPSLKRIPVVEKEVWQVVVRKLRVWSACETSEFSDTPPGEAACRPYCILVFNLYPAGRILTHQVHVALCVCTRLRTAQMSMFFVCVVVQASGGVPKG